MRAELNGFLSRNFAGPIAPPMDLGLAPAEAYVAEQVDVADARPMQHGKAPHDVFARYGFVLLPHRTGVADWDREVATVYAPEVAALIRERLFPGRRIEVLQRPKVIRRGGEQRYYAERIHADGPLTPDGYARNLGAFGTAEAIDRWRRSYAREEVEAFVSIGFWRTTNMRQPLRHMPLALCDPRSVDRNDIVPTTSTTISPLGRTTHHLVLRHAPEQAWVYYPEMTGAEVLAMKVCEFRKDQPDAHPSNVFHTAFHDPTTPEDAEPRQSCEHRVGVMILRD